MKIYAIWNSCGFENNPRCYVEAKNIDDLVKIMEERDKKDKPFGRFPGWDAVEISKKEMYHILNRFNEDDLDLVDKDEREAFDLWARMQSQTGYEKPIIEALRKQKLYKCKYSVNLTEKDILEIKEELSKENQEDIFGVTDEDTDVTKQKSRRIFDYPSVDESQIMRPITDGDFPIVDFGDSWGRIDGNGKPEFKVSKEQDPLWLLAFVAKWMPEPENLTDFGEQYLDEFYADYYKKIEISPEKDIEEIRNEENKPETKITSQNDDDQYRGFRIEIIERLDDIHDELYDRILDMAPYSDKWDEWSESQNNENEITITEEMLRNSGDENIDLLWELLDKIEEVKGNIRVNPRVETEEEK